MCGIAGFIDSTRNTVSHGEIVTRMTTAIRHRGPDDSGLWIDESCGLALGQRRLSIVDLSPEGHQPMHSANSRFVIVFNGEIYNFQSLRLELEKDGHTFRGHSDTEIMLAAFCQWGVRASVEKFVGMFAFVLWDKRDRLLYLSRDRMGEKPLYYGWNNGVFLFGSELKALRAHPKFEAEVDRAAIGLQLQNGFIPAPWSIYEKIYKLPAGTILTIPIAECAAEPSGFSPFEVENSGAAHPVHYWSVAQAVQRGKANPFRGTEDEASIQLEELLREVIGKQMIADVPLGAFLSGGIDSSAVVALMQLQSKQPVRTFSIGFHEKEYDEAGYAREMAQHLGTTHTDLYLAPNDALNVIPRLPIMYDEPFSDSSQIPTYLVSKLCREHVTVSLSGDGGDELFGGYERYPWALQNGGTLYKAPHFARSIVGKSLEFLPPEIVDAGFAAVKSLMPERLQVQNLGHKVQTLSRVLQYKNQRALYDGIMTHWDASKVVLGANGQMKKSPLNGDENIASESTLSQMLYSDMMTYLPDDIMAKVDRASMAVALEARAPLLDHRVVEFAWSLPDSFKLQGAQTKKVLKKMLLRHVPQKLIDRPKMGFRLPIDRWLRTELREWAEALLANDKLQSQGFLNVRPIRKKWREHLSGAHNWDQHLWDVLMFQSWIEQGKR